MTEQELLTVREWVQDLNAVQLATHIEDFYNSLETPTERTQFEIICVERAAELKRKTEVSKLFRSIHSEENRQRREIRDKKDQAEQQAKFLTAAAQFPDIPLELNRVGNPKTTIDNFLNIMLHDPYYAGIRYNEVTEQAEIHRFDDDGNSIGLEKWNDTTRAESKRHIELEYNDLRDDTQHDDAFRILLKSRSFNPITDYIKSLPKWDGKERCRLFLSDTARADNSEYTKAVSQMIFDGAIARAFNPGCKYDNVPVFIGAQGIGKTTLIRYLAVHDDYYGRLKTINKDAVAIESIRGKWIVEMAELVALKSATYQETVKDFITAQSDRYRIPFNRYPSDFQRRCIFIGSSNTDTFLSDMTGGRRWFPVELHCDGRTVYEWEKEYREEIDLCYAEAYHRYLNHKLLLHTPEDIDEEVKRRQAAAQEESWEKAEIESYITEEMDIGEYIYGKLIWQNILKQDLSRFTRAQQRYINDILRSIPYIEQTKYPVRLKDETTQRAFRKISDPGK